jgi:HPt (histidine-containing phosphotransfer) domain-containing protein
MGGKVQDSDTVSVLDPGPLTEAFGSFGAEALAMLDLFVHSIRPLIASAILGLDQGAARLAADSAHSAKGAANVTGAFRLGAVCQRIERLATLGDLNAARLAARELEPALAEVVREIERLKGEA